jgi:hypothetical protein
MHLLGVAIEPNAHPALSVGFGTRLGSSPLCTTVSDGLRSEGGERRSGTGMACVGERGGKRLGRERSGKGGLTRILPLK